MCWNAPATTRSPARAVPAVVTVSVVVALAPPVPLSLTAETDATPGQVNSADVHWMTPDPPVTVHVVSPPTVLNDAMTATCALVPWVKVATIENPDGATT